MQLTDQYKKNACRWKVNHHLTKYDFPLLCSITPRYLNCSTTSRLSPSTHTLQILRSLSTIIIMCCVCPCLQSNILHSLVSRKNIHHHIQACAWCCQKLTKQCRHRGYRYCKPNARIAQHAIHPNLTHEQGYVLIYSTYGYTTPLLFYWTKTIHKPGDYGMQTL